MEVSKVKIAIIDVATIPEKNVHPKKESFWHINKDMLPYKIHFFLMYGGLGAIVPYMIVIGITRMGLTACNLAAAFTAQQFVLIITNPGIGYLADYFNKLKAFIVGLTILQAILSFFLVIIPHADVLSIYQNKTHLPLNDTPACNLCNIFQDFNIISTSNYSSDYEMRKLLSYFEESNGVALECSKPSDTDLIDINLYILNKICDFPVSKEMVSFDSDLYNESLSSMTLMVVLVNESRNFSKVCVFTEQFSILKSTSSHDLIKKYCRTTSESENLKLQEDFDISKFEDAKCRNYSEYNLLEDELSPAATPPSSFRFWLFFICFISSSICYYSLFTLSDTACYESVQGVNYGRQIIWAAVSWGLVAPFAGFLNDYTQGYMTSWTLFMIFCCLQIWNLSRMHLVKPNSSDNILEDVKTVLKSAEFLAFEIGIFMNGFFASVYLSFLTWFVMIIGGNKLIIGLVQTAERFLGEVPIMFISDWMIKKFGHFNLVSLALFCQGIRFFFYSYIHNPWWIIPVEFLHGFTYGSFMPAMTSYAKLNAKPGTETTTQAIMYITFKAIGSGLGCVVAGYFFEYYGAHRTFYYASFLCMLATFINVSFTLFFWRRKKGFNVTKDVNNKSY